MIKKKIQLIGVIFTILSFVYIGYAIYKVDLKIQHIPISFTTLYISVLIIFIISFTIFLFGFGWTLVIKNISSVPIPFIHFMLVYCKTNIGKYLPGNVMHFAARNIVINKLGWPHSKILFSSILEVTFNLLSIFILLFVFKRKQLLSLFKLGIFQAQIYHYVLLGIVILSISTFIIIFRKKINISEYININVLLLALKEFFLYIIIFIISGLSLVFLMNTLFDISLEIHEIGDVILYYALSWLAGYIIIGSPGGIGIREAVMLFLLKERAFAEENHLLTIILLHRNLYIFGETLTFFIAHKLLKKIVNKQKFQYHLNKSN